VEKINGKIQDLNLCANVVISEYRKGKDEYLKFLTNVIPIITLHIFHEQEATKRFVRNFLICMSRGRKMINKRSKMNRTNKKAVDYLRNTLGINKIYSVPHSRFSKDAWHVADLFYIEEDEYGNGFIKIAQVQCNKWHDMEKYQKFTDETGVKVLIMLFKDRKDAPSLRLTR
jgi:hypothetical protein